VFVNPHFRSTKAVAGVGPEVRVYLFHGLLHDRAFQRARVTTMRSIFGFPSPCSKMLADDFYQGFVEASH